MFLNTDNNLQRKYFFSPHVWMVGLNLPVVENDRVCVSVCAAQKMLGLFLLQAQTFNGFAGLSLQFL